VSARRILRTTAFRLALAYLVLFSLSALALLGFVYVVTSAFTERQLAATIDAEIAGLVEHYRARGLIGLHRAVQRRSTSQPPSGGVYLLTDPMLRPLAGNIDDWPDDLPDGDGVIRFAVDAFPDGEQLERRSALARTFRLGGGYRMLVGRDIEDRVRVQQLIAAAMLWGTGLTLLLGLAGGLLMSRPMLRRIDDVNRTTREIMAGDLSRRLPESGSGDELDELAGNVNRMLARIERLLEAMRQVTDNVAHDLRTPLNRLRSRIEVALMGELAPEQARAVLEAGLKDADGLIFTFNALLDIARAESGAARESFEEVDLGALAADVAELYQPLAEDRDIRLVVQAPQGVRARLHRHLIAQALANLLDNAVKYTMPGGRITLEVQPGPPPAVVVADSGPGIPECQRARVLERFVRLEPDRSTPGNGLGLSLVEAVTRLHHAELVLEDARPGLAVTLRLPANGLEPAARPS
jgi:signal transduction histidine kinase